MIQFISGQSNASACDLNEVKFITRFNIFIYESSLLAPEGDKTVSFIISYLGTHEKSEKSFS